MSICRDLQLYWKDGDGNLCGHHDSLHHLCQDSSPDMRVEVDNFAQAKRKKKNVLELDAYGALDLDDLDLKVPSPTVKPV